MLTVFANSPKSRRFCDGVSRRNFIKIGALGMGGLALPQLLQAEAASGIRKSHKAVIMIYLPGGPPHQDTFDLKLDAPSEIRGEFRPIPTNVPGIQICEHLPRIARITDKLAIIRSISDAVDDHSDFMCMTGRRKNNQPPGGWPTFGATASKILGPVDPGVPPFIGLEPRMQHRPYTAATPGFLGVGHNSFRPAGEGKADMALNGISIDRLADRRALLNSFDNFRRDVDSSGLMEGIDAFRQQAFGVLTSSKLLDALDLSKEDGRLRERYGKGDAKVHGDAAPMLNEQFLTARRLVEAGARVVTVAYGFWDTHGNNFGHLRQHLPTFDTGISALVEDIYARGLDRDVSVVVWGEFGRTPKINDKAGRDHWAPVQAALLAGGGMPAGQVIGSTDKIAAYAADRPIHYRDVLATIYRNLGIDSTSYVRDQAERPVRILPEDARPIRELILPT